ncbi:MAG TPA: HAMP domain-containing sensor histidine kinase, partial [Candidatus Staskawiczbacteria bacterium]|nr:HAMP domain-containing sensor histidine kinase [Candidatus Staskawiczbacteria bacterium]
REAYEIEKRAHEELEKMNESKSQFMAITQHHLRTPLSSTMGYLDLLLTNVFGKVPKKISEILVKIRGATQGEIKIVNDLLNISAFQMGKNVLQAEDGVDAEQIIKEIFDSQAMEMKEKGLYSKIDAEGDIPTISADKSKLTAALTNIIDNAIKYTKKGGITASLRAEKDKVSIFIKDTGMGISKECLSKLFSSTFERCSDAQKAFAVGKGIGLYLSYKIIELHGGKIWAESEGQGRGAIFCIELPIKSVK